MTLTNTAIDALQPGRTVADEWVPGLSAKRHGSGVSFSLYYRTRAGQQRRVKVGAYPVMSIAEARRAAKALLGAVAAGEDPVAGWRDARAAPTMNELWERVEREHYTQEREWNRQAKALWLNYLAKPLGGIKVSSIKYSDVASVHSIHSALNTTTQGNRVLAVLSKMLALAERWGLRPTGSNPCQHVERFKERKRRRYATPEEFKAIGLALQAEAVEHPDEVAFLQLMLFSGARPSELLRATPAMVERKGPAGVLRIAEGKTGFRSVYLPPIAMDVLDGLPKDRTHLVGRVTVPRKLWQRVTEKAGCSDLWVRDLRRTFATVALSNGMSLSLLGELLGHKSAQTTKIYGRLFEEQAHEASAATAGVVERMLNAPDPARASGGDRARRGGAAD